MTEHHKPFYGVDILRAREQVYITNLLKKYRNEPANEALQKKIWDELQLEKNKGTLKIPFKVTLKKDPSGLFAPQIEIMLDTKV